MNAATRAATRLTRPVLAKPFAQPPRTFTTLTPLRPTLAATSSAIRPTPAGFAPSPAAGSAVLAADLVPRAAITAHPALGGGAQLRCGPRNTMNGATRLIQKRRLGFLKRMRSKSGRRILQRRRDKGRKSIAQ